MAMQKFATQLDEHVLEELRATAKETGQSISSLVQDALIEHLRRIRVRPAFREAMGTVLDEHAELLRRLAR
jgi:metal-responsive CopG/Arc/MetJ family transcriptional regulator